MLLNKIIIKSKLIKIIVLGILLSSIFQERTFSQAGAGTSFDPHPMHWGRYWARGLFDRSLIYVPVWNIGNIGDQALKDGNKVNLQWPGSEGLSYGSTFGFFVGSKLPNMYGMEGKVVPEDWPNGYDTDSVIILSTGNVRKEITYISRDKTHRAVFSPRPGYFNNGFYGYIHGIDEDVNQDGILTPQEDVNFNGQRDLNLDPPQTIYNSMAISTDKRTWPEYWPGGSYIGDTRERDGFPPRTLIPGSRVGKWNGEYKASTIADQETYYVMDDHENDYLNDYYAGQNYWPMKNSDGTPNTNTWDHPDSLSIAGMGIQVESRSYTWFHPLAEDILVSVYRITNYSDYDLNNIVTGMYAQARIGGSGINNRAEFVLATYDIAEATREEFDILYQWNNAPDDLNTYQNVGYFGFAFLESPGIEYDGIDNDFDHLIDETQYDGIDNDGDWRPFADTGIFGLPGTANNGSWDTEDTNLNGALDPGEDVNLNAILDFEDVKDDRGTDGIGPDENSWPGPDEDGSETNGFHDPGEPNFDETDIDEADQAGLKHVYVYENNLLFKDPKGFWDRYLGNNEDPEVVETDEEIDFTFGARSVKIETAKNLGNTNRREYKRFTIALIMGNNERDLKRNKSTMQQIYNENYRFLTPPEQPNLVSNVTDGKVQLYWDTGAEFSKDPFYGLDFNGYRLYKSSDPDFLDLKTITDAFGNVLLYEPLEIFDKNDGLTGAHPVPFPGLGISYDMGEDSGLKHSYVDTLIENGRTYYYAVSSIDAGNDWDFGPGAPPGETFRPDGTRGERGLVTIESQVFSMPSESPFNITVNQVGNVVFRDRNTAVCIPVEPASGYVEVNVDSSKIEHTSGFARGGFFNIDIFNKEHAINHLNDVYEISFTDDDALGKRTPYIQWGRTTGIMCVNLTSGDTLYNEKYATGKGLIDSGFTNIEKEVYDGVKHYFKFPIDYSDDVNFGIDVIKYDENGRTTRDWTKWATDTKSNLRVFEIEPTTGGFALPFDIELRVSDHIVDTSFTHVVRPTLQRYPINFSVWNVNDPNNPIKLPITVKYTKNTSNPDLPMEMYGQVWDSTIVTVRFPKDSAFIPSQTTDPMWGSWSFEFRRNVFTAEKEITPPEPGDIFRFFTERNPTRQDTFRYTIEGGVWEVPNSSSKDFRKIFVVPDPYVGANTLETIYDLAGNSPRRVDFVNLPPECTIYIFTSAGQLVKKINHSSALDFGRHSWDLTSDDGPEVSFGMYFFVVEGEKIEAQKGKFAIIK